MEKELENLYYVTKDLEQYYNLKKSILNYKVSDKKNINSAYKLYVKMIFNRYERLIFTTLSNKH